MTVRCLARCGTLVVRRVAGFRGVAVLKSAASQGERKADGYPHRASISLVAPEAFTAMILSPRTMAAANR